MAGAAYRGPRRGARKTVRGAARTPVALPAQARPDAPLRSPRKLAVRRDWLLATTALLPIAAGPVMAQPAPNTGPTGGQVVAGQAGIARAPGRTTITQGTDRAAIDWQQFNVGSQHTVQFVQPSQGSWTLNRVVGPDPSVIAGRVQANGGVAIVNQSGMVFARGAQVNVGSLIASAPGITNENFMAGRMAFDQAARPGARVENHGTITVADRGLAALVGPGVSNSGVIRARLGRVALGAAETFVLDLAGDGLIGIDVTQAVRTAPEGGQALVTNSGVIEAAGGSVLITAHAASGLVEDLVRQTGRIEAPTVGTRTGEVAIRAQGGGVRVDGRVAATGAAGERGGRIAVQATGTVTAGATARIDASGGVGGGQVLVGTTGRGRDQTMARQTIVERGAEIRADATVSGDGGMLVLNSLERTEMRGALSARGGAQGGNGGFVELSGQAVIEAAGTVDVRAPAGANGELLLDPQNIIVSNTTPGAPAGLPGGETIAVNVTTATETVTAGGGGAIEWTRVATAAITGFAGTVTLDAARDIIVDSAITKDNGGLSLIAGRSITLGAAITVSGDFIASAATGTLAVNAAVTAGTGQTITLRADTMTFGAGGSLAAPSGTVEIGTATAGRDLRVGSSVADTLVLAVANLDAITAGTLRLGRTTIAGLGTVSADDVTIADALARPAGSLQVFAGDDITLAAAVTVGGNFVASAGGTIAVDAAVSAGAGQTLTMRTDTLSFGGGSLAAVGGVVEIGPQTAGRNLRVGSSVANTLVLAQANLDSDTTNITAGTLRLGQTTITGLGTVTAGDVTVAAGAGFTRGAGTGLEILAGGNLTTDGGLGANAMRLVAGTGTIDIGFNVRASSLILSAGTAIDQTGGNIQARAGATTALPITATAGGGAISLDNANNGTFSISAGSATAGFTVAADTIATTGAIAGTTVSLTADTGALTIGGDIRATTSVTLAGAAGIDQTAGTIQHAGNAATQLAVTANASGGNVALAEAGNGNFALGASAASGTFTVAADTLATTGAIGGTAVSLTADTGALTIDGDIRATSLVLAGATGISQTDGNIRHSAGAGAELAVTANAAGGAIDLAEAGNGALALGAGTAGGSFTVVADALRTTGAIQGTAVSLTADDGALTIGADIRATSLALVGEDGITQSGGTIAHVTAATELAITAQAADGAIAIDRAGNGVFALGASAADDGLSVAAQALRVTGTIEGDAVSLTARTGALALEADIRATGLTLAAATGISQAAGTTIEHAGGAGTVLGLAASVSGTGAVALTQGNGALNLLSGGTADGNFAVTSAEGLTVAAGAVLSVAGAATLTVQGADNALTIDGAIHAQSVALAAAGDITQGADGVLAFRDALTGAADFATALALTVSVTGSNDGIALTGDNGRLAVNAASTTDGDIAIRGRDIDIAGAVTAGGGNATFTAFDDAGTGAIAMTAAAAITADNATFNAAREITQDGAATIALDAGAGRLTVRGGSGDTGSRAGSIALLGTNTVGEVDLRATGAIEASLAGSVALVQADGASVALTAVEGMTVAAGGSGVTATGDVRLVANTLDILGGVAAGDGATLTLRTDGIAISGAGGLTVTGGTLEIGPRSVGRDVAVDAAASPTALHIAAAALQAADAATIRIGRTTTPGGTVTGGDVTFAEALSFAAGTAFQAVGGGDIAVNAALGAGSLRLDAGGAIALGGVDVTASGTGSGIRLHAGTSITQNATGALVAGSGTQDLVAHAGSGGITLFGEGDFRLADGGTPSGAGGARSLYAAGSIALTTDGALTVAAAAQANAAGATLALQGQSILIQAPLITPGDSGTVALTATGAGETITQTAAGTITANLLTATADGAIALDEAPNLVALLGAISFETGFGFRSANASGLTIGNAVAAAGGGNADITFIADSGTLEVNAAISAGTGTVTLEATAGSIAQAATGAAITAGRLEVTAGVDALLAPTGVGHENAVAVLGTSTVGGTLAFLAAGDLALDGTIARSGAGGVLSVEARGTLTANAGSTLTFDTISLAAAGAMTLSGTVGVTGGGAPTSIVRLGAGGDITQDAGAIVADALGLRGGGSATLTAAGNDIRQVAAGVVGNVALATTGALQTATIAGVSLPGSGVTTVSGVRGSSVSLAARELTSLPSTTLLYSAGIWATALDGTVQLRADRLTVAAHIMAGQPDLPLDFNGTLDIAPLTTTRAVRLGLDDLGSLHLAAADFSLLYARTLVIGHDSPTAGALTVAGPVTTLFIDRVTLRGGSIALDSTFQIPSSGALLSLHATGTAGDIVQGAAGAVFATRLSAVADAGSVLMGSPGTLNAVSQVSGGAAAGEDFIFRNGGSFTVAAPGIAAAGADVELSAATGGISQTTGARIAADRLRVTAPGTVALNGGGSLLAADLNAVGTLAPSSAGHITLRNATALTVEGATAAGAIGGAGTIVIEAAGITLAGDIVATEAGGRVVLRTGANFDAPGVGDIVQDSGVIRAEGLSAAAGGDIILDGANQVQRLRQGVSQSGLVSGDSIVTAPGGTFLIANSLTNLAVEGRVNAGTGGAISVLSNGLGVTFGGTAFFAPGGVVQFAPFTAGGTIGLGAFGGFGDTTTISAAAIQQVDTGRLIIGALGPADQVTSGTITLRGAIDLTGLGAPQVLELRSGGDILANGFTLSVPQISAIANGSVRLGTTSSRIGSIVASTWDGVSGIRAGGPVIAVTTAGVDAGSGLFTVAAPIALTGAGIGGTITLQAPDFALLPGATIDTGAGAAGRIELRSTRTLSLGGDAADAGTARLTATELALLDTHGGTIAAVAPDIRLRGAWSLAPAVATRLELDLAAGGIGAIRQVEGGLSVGNLAVSALFGSGIVQIDQAGNALPVVGVQALGAIDVRTDGALEVRRTASTSGGVTYRATDITLSTTGLVSGQTTIDANGAAVNLTATAGDITGTAAQAAVRGGTLTATATAGEVRLTGDNTVGTLAATARDGVAFRATGATTVGAVGAGGAGTEVAGTIDIAAASLTLNDVLGSGTVVLDAATGDLMQNGGARLSAATLAATAAGTLRLAGANGDGTARNTIQDLTALSAGGDITLRNALALTLDLPIGVGIDRTLTLEAASLTLANNLSAAGPSGQVILRTGSFNGGVASGGDITQTGGTISAAALAALAGGSISIDLAGNTIGTLGGGLAANGAALGLGLSAGTDATLRSAGFAGYTTLGVEGVLQVGNGGALTLRADDLAIGAELRAPGGVITLLPLTANAGIGYVLGGASGSVNAGRITLDSTELGFLPSGTAAAELRLGALGVTGSVDIAGTVDLVDGFAPRVGRLTLAGDGALTQAAGTMLDVATLSANFPNGAVLLDPGTAGNRIRALAGVTAGGNVEIRGGAGLMELRDGGSGSAIAAPTGATIVLRADDLDIQSAILATAGVIHILPETLGRTVTLGGPDAAAGTLALGTAELARVSGSGGTAALRLVIGADGAPAAPGTVRAAGDIIVAGDVALRAGGVERVGTLELVAGTPGTVGGSVRQSGGSVDVATVTGTAQGDFQLGRDTNRFDTATAIAAGTLPAAGATGRVDLATAGDLAASAITAPVSVRVAAGGALSAGGITAPIIAMEGGSVRLVGLIQGSTSVSIDSTGGVTQDAGALIVTGLFTLNGGSISLPEQNEILELNGLVATGPVLALNTVLSVLVSGTVSAVGSLSLTTTQGLTVADTGSISVTGGPGSATLQAGGAIDYAGILSTTGAASLTAGGALGFSGSATTGGFITFGAGTALTLAGTITAGGAVTGTATGAIGTTAQISAAGDATLTAGGALTAGGRIESTGGDIELTGATGLAADGTFIADGAARLVATTGALTLAGTLSAGGTVDVTGGGAVGTTAQVTGGGNVAVIASGALTASGRIESTGGTLLMTGIDALSSTGTLVADGAATLRATGGALTLAGTLTAGGDATITGLTGVSATGTIDATGNALVSATGAGAAVTLGGTLDAGGSATVTAGGAIGTTAQVTAAGDATFTAGGTLTAGGRIESTGGALSLVGAALSVDATLVADGAATLRATTGAVGLAGSLDAGGNAIVEGATGLIADGAFGAGGTLRLATLAGDLTLAGTVTAGGTATVTAGGAIGTTAQVTAAGDATFTAGGALTATGRIESTGGDIALTGATGLTSGATLVADGDATLRATGGSVALTGSLDAGGNAIVEAATGLTADGTFGAGGTLRFDTTAGGLTLAGTLTAGGTATVTAGGAIGTTAQVTAAGDATFTAGGTLTASGSIESTGGDLALTGGTGLVSDAALVADGDATLRAVTGTVGLTGAIAAGGDATIEAASGITADGFFVAGGALRFATLAGALDLAGIVLAGDVGGGGSPTGTATFTAGGAIRTSAEVVAAGDITFTAGGTLTAEGTVESLGGTLAMTGGAGLVSSATLLANRDATLRATTGTVGLTGTLAAMGDTTVEAASGLSADGSFGAGGALRFATITGNLTLAGTLIAGNTATVTAGGAIGTTAQISVVGDATFAAGGTLTASGRIEAAGALAMTGGTGLTSNATLVADGAATLRATGGAVGLTGSLGAGGAITVEAATGLAANGSFTAGGALRFATAAGGLTLGGTVVAGGGATMAAGGAMNTTAQVTAAGDTTFSAGGTLTASGRIESTAGALAMTGGTGLTSGATLLAAGGATLRAPGGPVTLTGTLVAGPVAIEAGGALSSTGTVRSRSALAMTAGGTITLAGTHVAATTLSAMAGGGLGTSGTLQAGSNATLGANGGDLTQSGTVSAGGEARLSAGGALANTGLVSAGTTLALAAGGGLSQTGTVAAGGAATLAAGGALVLSGQTTAGTDLDVTAGGTATLSNGKITASQAVRLTAGQGVTVQSFQIDPTTILLQTGGAMSLTDATLVSSDSIRLAAGAITLRRSNFNTNTLDVDSAGTLLLDGGQFTIGRAVAFSGPSGIQTVGRIFVTPRGGELPAVIFDTRSASITPDPLTLVEPDQPGLPGRQQRTQVRLPGTEAPGAFGPASAAPAGTMVLDIDAGRSAVFLLLDGGTATGTIASAGRIGIHGTGGSAELRGTLTDVTGTPVDGAAAARLADSTRPAASGALTRYRLNGCVVSSVNCIVPSQIISIPQAPPQQLDLRLGNNRITDPEVQVPNVGDEDY